MSDFAPTSPDIPVNSGIVSTEKQFSDSLTTDLTDDEIKRCLGLILPIKKKWQEKFINRFSHDAHFNEEQAMEMISHFQDEISYTLATEANVLVSVDVTPLLEGNPMVIEYQGVIEGHALSQYGMDHEKKTWEVQKAKERNEAYLGQKENPDTTRAKRRNKK